MLYIFWNLAFEGRRHAARLGADIHRVYLLCGVWTLFIWVLYPVAWGVCEGGNVIAPDSEAVFYGILDFCAKPVFSIMLIVGHWDIDPARMGLRIRDVDDDPPRFPTKEQLESSHNGSPSETNGNGVSTGVDVANA